MSSTAAPKVWLITGTSSGFGRRLVASARARGDRVIATARTIEKIQDLPAGPDLHILQLDVDSSPEIIKSRVDEAAKIWGTIDVLVNNAGKGLPGILEEGGVERLIAQYKTNVFGVLNVTNAVVPHMRKTGGGTVVVFGSRSAWKPEIIGMGFYGSSKAAVHALTETLSLELSAFNIRVLLVEPGAFRTENIYGYAFHTDNPIPENDPLRAKGQVIFTSVAGTQPGDPNKAVEVIVDVVRGEGVAAGRDWPLYLVLGKDAERDIRFKIQKVLKHLDDWSDVVRGVDLDECAASA
ncbi:NAD(P)-binding protein [Leucogyrophana mollusca]|uniref:NAD(P)-binding protein n=1 Tax=Leucogyrophana mollusca TaxID=85980 RepID=A0ACB8BMW4_9AGAM|nr:NAD(P)-binding protein [Leucogyrophana mollusca]